MCCAFTEGGVACDGECGVDTGGHFDLNGMLGLVFHNQIVGGQGTFTFVVNINVVYTQATIHGFEGEMCRLFRCFSVLGGERNVSRLDVNVAQQTVAIIVHGYFVFGIDVDIAFGGKGLSVVLSDSFGRYNVHFLGILVKGNAAQCERLVSSCARFVSVEVAERYAGAVGYVNNFDDENLAVVELQPLVAPEFFFEIQYEKKRTVDIEQLRE